MTMPLFEEYDPGYDCACPGCAQHRRALARARAIPLRDGGHPAARGARRALVLATAAGVVLGGGGGTAVAVANPEPVPGPLTPGSPQGGRAPLHGPSRTPPAGPPAVRRQIDRATIINRAKLWLDAKVPYSMELYWTDGYRQDCSGYVSMVWNLGTNEWTGSLDKFATLITKDELLPGDMLLFHNPADPNQGSHVTLFGGWVDETRTHYIAYEQTRPYTRKQATPYGYWNNATKYLPYRFNGLPGGTLPAVPPATPVTVPAPEPDADVVYPGAAKFGPGANNEYVARLGRMLSARGGARFYPQGTGSLWTDSDRLATEAFQRAQGWTGEDADGLPGPATWQLLVQKQGKDIPPAPTGAAGPPSAGASGYPGLAAFRPGASGPAVTALGRQLTKKGFGKYYTTGPGPRWGEADRRAVEAFQRAQGWRGASADGYPGPETWRRLFA
ncbi:peptidoglycan-binding protein [Streptomyces sp. NBC_00536]|uniref:peptidoglycan-binding protein n=1 Tax=Streptomyces sp. NBC_00536 TaxID=2975769 RepID=UPI002E801DCE|nr:peptidoglycan-binding protein [Streptomyces sp. NBC_00536]WUC83712.1 peptidoglycan-binding protein [Streptomyces sp. NBC_00536]